MSSRFPRYARLIRLYPKAYRDKYGQQMTQTLADMLDHTATARQRRTIWAHVALDFPVSLAKTQLQDVGSVVTHKTPKYVIESGLLSGLLVLPFFVALLVNVLDEVINNHTLYGSWLWRMPTIGIWVLWLPAAAFILAASSYLRFLLQGGAKRPRAFLRQTIDLKQVWPILIPGVVAFGILFMLVFHDSTHCWVQNPVRDVTQFHRTLTCTRSGLFGG